MQFKQTPCPRCGYDSTAAEQQLPTFAQELAEGDEAMEAFYAGDFTRFDAIMDGAYGRSGEFEAGKTAPQRGGW